MSTTAEIRRSWPLLKWWEKILVLAKAFFSTVGNGVGYVLSAWGMLKVARGDFAVPQASALWGVGVVGFAVGIGLYLQRPGIRGMRRTIVAAKEYQPWR